MDIKIVRTQELGDVVIDFRINEYRPNDCFFGFSTVRDCRLRCGGGIPKGDFGRQGIGHFFFGFFGF
jgi:hypothetical protein